MIQRRTFSLRRPLLLAAVLILALVSNSASIGKLHDRGIMHDGGVLSKLLPHHRRFPSSFTCRGPGCVMYFAEACPFEIAHASRVPTRTPSRLTTTARCEQVSSRGFDGGKSFSVPCFLRPLLVAPFQARLDRFVPSALLRMPDMLPAAEQSVPPVAPRAH